MTRKLLIANRGEIAARVITTARRLGIATVAVHSDADAQALHVTLAEEAVRIGPAPVSESYLDTQAILQAAQATGADAIHPGYGFLSENPDFVEAVAQAGLTFVGPPASAIRAMGLKDAAKALMDKAGVPVVPGYHGDNQDALFLAGEADQIGYPVLIKARAGGGGKGMRLVKTAADFADALASAQREAQASFGDPACLIEKFVTSPRHIEIQVFADAQGNVVHLFERDCSLQRRHQKVIEEAPAPDMPADVRAAMGKAATDAARAIGYVGAGTVEFIADGSGPLRTDGFWFMEMNTRLQVEHPVTEAITGLDLVEWQLRVACGEPLPATQDDLKITGHAFEARLYAEDADAGFLPATGHLALLRFPEGTRFERGPIRIDAGVREGDEITPYYDPMIAKLITHGPDRATALRQLSDALARTRVAGTVTNIAFLKRLADHEGFAAGQVDTGLIARDLGTLTARAPKTDANARLTAALTALNLPGTAQTTNPWSSTTGWRVWGTATHSVTLIVNDEPQTTTVRLLAPNRFEIDGTDLTAHRTESGLRFTRNGTTTEIGIHADSHEITIFDNGTVTRFARRDPLARDDTASAGGNVVLAPMPGLVIKLDAKPGDHVEAGTPLLVLEAMKMEHTLRAPRGGVIAEVLATLGAQVENRAILIRLEEDDA